MSEHKRGYLSFSQLLTAAQCGEAYRRKYMNDEGTWVHNVPALVGTAFHEAAVDFEIEIESKSHWLEWDKQAAILTALTKDRVRKTIADEGIDSDELRFYGAQDLPFHFRKKIPQMSKAYVEQREEEVTKLGFRWGLPEYASAAAAMSLEVSCDLEIAEFPFKGFIDQVFFDSKRRLVIRDLKTGKPKIEHAMQLECYRLALKKVHGVDAAYGQVLYLNKPAAYAQVVKWSLSDDEVEDLTGRLVQSVKSGMFLINGPFNGACGMCDFRPDCKFGQVDVHGVA